MKTKLNTKTSGITLIELVIAMAVVAIGLVLTVPAMKDFTDTNRQADIINRLVRDITYAKGEAVTRGTGFTVSTVSGTAAWNAGWTIADTATGLTVLRTAPPLTIAGQTLLSTAGFTSISFRPDGSQPAAAAAFTVELCQACTNVANREKQITVSPTGRISLNNQFACVPATPACP